MSNITTIREIIKSVPDKWKRRYYDATYTQEDQWRVGLNRPTKETYDKLIKLDLETASKEDIAQIIGNDSWTRLNCDQCNREVDKVIRLGEVEDYESATAYICPDCLIDALRKLI